MTHYLVYFLVLGLINVIKCDVSLQIIKNIDDFFTPVTTVTVEENVGTTFSLVCELVSSDNDSEFDENLVWFWGESPANQSRFTMKNKKTILSSSEINKSVKKFSPLQLLDKGNYYCCSVKFKLCKNVQVIVRNDIKHNEQRPLRETSFCNEQMFQCMSNGLCIIQHYVCDGKADCKDGSDESAEKCNGDPCKDKIPCEDGRCIPTAWCCDRHHDLNCTVTNRPKCCQVLSESYEELEYGFPNVNQTPHNGARYLFISVCIVSIAFSIVLLLLILSKVVIFAKKSALEQNMIYESIAMNQRNMNALSGYVAPCELYTYRNSSRSLRSSLNSDVLLDSTSDVSDPLLFPPRFNSNAAQNDQPPSYIDVLRNSRSLSEPPPPYTSREVLNVNEERNVRV